MNVKKMNFSPSILEDHNWYVSRTQLSISRNAVLCTRSIVRSVTRRTLAKRPALWKSEKEHQSRSSSAIHEHCRLEGHSVDQNKTKVLSTEVNTFKRRIKEAIQIKLTKPALNRDNGYELAAIYDTILTPKRR